MNIGIATLHYYEVDRNWLLHRICRKFGKNFEVPADVLVDVIEMQGFRIQGSDEVPPTLFGYLHCDERAIILANRLEERLQYPQAAPQVILSTLAHELGHIRLHAVRMSSGVREPEWEDEAFHYAQVFLVPLQQLLARLEFQAMRRVLQQTHEVMWGYVLALAEYFRVSGAFMARTLEMYGFIRFCGKTRTIALRHSSHDELIGQSSVKNFQPQPDLVEEFF